MTEFLELFHFLRPWWFVALIPVCLACAMLWLKQKHAQKWQRYVAPHLLPFLLDKAQVKQKRWPIAGLAIAWTLTVIALAGPVWQKVPQPVEQDISALVLCWDLSPSMLAEDIKPSRLERSRLKIIDLLNNRKEGQIALIAYSGEAYNVTPLSDDRQTIINLLPALSPTTLPTVGSNPEMALDNAHKLLKDSGIVSGHIMFITDDIDPVAFDYIENEMSTSPHQLTLWVVGSTEGAPIPLPSGGFAKNNGNMVLAKVNETELLSLAQRTGAYYIPMQTLGSDIETISQMLRNPMENQTQTTSRVFDQWFEHGQFFAILLLPFVIFLFRKGWIFVFVLSLGTLTLTENEVYAAPLEHLWQTQDQKAQEKLKSGDESAAMEFSSPKRRGAALYHLEKYEESAKQFALGAEAEDLYNMATALTRAGKYEEAIESYDKALEKRPDWNLAIDNRDIAKKLAEISKQRSDQQQDGEPDEQKEGSDQDQQKQEGDSQSEQDKQDGEQQSSDQQSANDEGSEGEQQDSEQSQSSTENDSSEKPEENPFSQAGEQEEEDKNEEQDMQQAQQREAGEDEKTEQDDQQEQHALVQNAEMSEEQSEEQQKLEQWLRKVPDDPSGLLRNKFQYEYDKRRRSMESSSSYSNDDPEKRW